MKNKKSYKTLLFFLCLNQACLGAAAAAASAAVTDDDSSSSSDSYVECSLDYFDTDLEQRRILSISEFADYVQQRAEEIPLEKDKRLILYDIDDTLLALDKQERFVLRDGQFTLDAILRTKKHGLTGCLTARFFAFAAETMRDFKALGISLDYNLYSIFFQQGSYISKREDFAEYDPTDAPPSIFKSVIYTSSGDKGQALRRLLSTLDKHNLVPREIYFVDNDEGRIREVVQAVRDDEDFLGKRVFEKTKVICFHYPVQ